jgi:virginiamycin B lyase
MFSSGGSLGSTRARVLTTLIGIGALALLLVPSGAQAQQKKLKVSVQTSSQTQALNQGQLQVKYNAKGLDKLTATAKATPTGGGQVNLAGKATKNNPKKGTLRLPLTNAGEAALEDCTSLNVRVTAKGKPSKNANASRRLNEDDPVCAEPVREFDLLTSASTPYGITVGGDGALWFAEPGAGAESLGRITTDGDYSRTHIPVPDFVPPGNPGGHVIMDVAAAPDGTLWASSGGNGAQSVRKIDPASGAVTAYQVNARSGTKIAAAPDGSAWVSNGSTLIRVAPDGTAEEFPIADPSPTPINIDIYGLTVGADGVVWFTTPTYSGPGPSGTAAVGRFDPTTQEVEVFPLSDPDKDLGQITTDRAGRLWFTTPRGNTIGRIDPNSGQIVEFQIPTEDSKPNGITFGNDGSIWFTQLNTDNIGRYDPASGTFTEYPLETNGAVPWEIVEGPDGMIYFTQLGSGKVGQLDPAKAPTGAPNESDGQAAPPFTADGRCSLPGMGLCQQQISTGGTFQIGTALTQVLPPGALTLTATLDFGSGQFVAPAQGPMFESLPLDVEVGGQAAVTRVGLAGHPVLNNLIPLNVTVPIDLYVAPVGSTEGGCVIGPIVQNLAEVPDEEGDPGSPLYGDQLLSQEDMLQWTGQFEDTTFAVPEARGCGALTEVINTLLSLPSESGENAISLPFSLMITPGEVDADNPPAP